MNTLRITVALVITVIWAAAYITSIVDRSFAVPPELLPLMLGVVGFLFGKDIIKIGRNGDS